MSKPWFLYLLRCADGSLYTGVTTDPQRRTREHNAGRGGRYTAGRRPTWLAGTWQFVDRASAQRAEARLRHLSRAKKDLLAAAGHSFEGAPFHGPLHDRYCPRCGHELTVRLQDSQLRQICVMCGRVYYRNAKPCAGVLAVREGKVLLVRRSIEPYLGCWDIPGGFLEEWELPGPGAIREMREETGLEVRLTDLFGFYVDEYPYQNEHGFTLNIYFLAQVVGGEEQPGDDAAEVAWFGADELPKRIAFAHARLVLQDWVRWVRRPEDHVIRDPEVRRWTHNE